ISQRSDARGSPAAISTRLALRTCSMVATRTANLSRCVLRCRGSRWANSALIPSAQTAIPLACVTARSHAETTRDRCITPSFSPSTYHRRKLMDGEGIDKTFPDGRVQRHQKGPGLVWPSLAQKAAHPAVQGVVGVRIAPRNEGQQIGQLLLAIGKRINLRLRLDPEIREVRTRML